MSKAGTRHARPHRRELWRTQVAFATHKLTGALRRSEAAAWTPVRRGAAYCSPGCGRGCTHREYRRAAGDCVKLCAALGRGWTPHVWENLGWHHAAVSPCGRVKVHPASSGWMAFLSGVGESGGLWVGSSRTAKGSVRDVVRIAKGEVARLAAMVAGL